jgi:hypothetical protein
MLCIAMTMIIELARAFEQDRRWAARKSKREADAKRVSHVSSCFSNITRLELASFARVALHFESLIHIPRIPAIILYINRRRSGGYVYLTGVIQVFRNAIGYIIHTRSHQSTTVTPERVSEALPIINVEYTRSRRHYLNPETDWEPIVEGEIREPDSDQFQPQYPQKFEREQGHPHSKLPSSS